MHTKSNYNKKHLAIFRHLEYTSWLHQNPASLFLFLMEIHTSGSQHCTDLLPPEYWSLVVHIYIAVLAKELLITRRQIHLNLVTEGEEETNKLDDWWLTDNKIQALTIHIRYLQMQLDFRCHRWLFAHLLEWAHLTFFCWRFCLGYHYFLDGKKSVNQRPGHCFLFQGLVVQWVSRLPGEDSQKGGLPGTLQRASTHLGQNGTVTFPTMIARTLHLFSYF